MARKQVDYARPQLIHYLRELANSGRPWQELQKDVLPKVSCRGEIPPPHAECPDVERRPRLDTDMDRTAIRHALRDICTARTTLDETTNDVLTREWLERQRAWDERDEYCGISGGWGKFHRLRQDIEKIESAATRVAKIEVLEREKRRLVSVADEAARRFALVEDRRFFLDQTRKRYAGSFPEIKDWSVPTDRSAPDHRRMIEIALDEIDFETVGLGGETVYFLEHVSGRWIGNSQLGPLFFTSMEPAQQYADASSMMGLGLKAEALTEDNLRGILGWFFDHHRFLIEKPKDASWLFEVYPQLVSARPADDGELSEALELAGRTNDGAW